MADIKKIETQLTPTINPALAPAENSRRKKETAVLKDSFAKSNKTSNRREKLQPKVKATRKPKGVPAGMDFTTKAAIAGGTLGAAAGSFLGYKTGWLESQKTQVSHQVWQEPVMERKYLGNIPSDYYNWGWGFGGGHVVFDGENNVQGGSPVYRDAPLYNPDGTVQIKTVEADLSSQRFGLTFATISGLLLGGLGGVLGGIALGLIARLSKAK